MKHADWLQPTRPKAAIIAGVLAVQCMLLLLLEGSEKPLIALLAGLAAALPVLVATRSAAKAVALSGVVTIAAPFIVESATNVIYAFIVVLVIYAWGDDTRPRTSLAIGVAVLALNEILTEVFEELSSSPGSSFEQGDLWFIAPAVLEAVVISALVVGLGSVLATTRRQAAAMVGLERANGEMALEAQRHRIARDLHDVAAHHLSSIVVRTSTARKLGDSKSIEEAVSFAGDTAEEALTAMRQIVTLLRADQGVTQPGLADLDSLVDSSLAASLRVSIDCDDAAIDRLGRSADLALSRVVRESLANIAQHSDATSASVIVAEERDGTSDMVTLTVTDPGPTASGESTGTGLGLIGMRERVEPLRGTFHAGPDGEGGWVVAVRLPLGPRPAEVEPS